MMRGIQSGERITPPVTQTGAGNRVTTVEVEASLANRKGRGSEINLEQEEMEERAVAAKRRRDEGEKINPEQIVTT